jgi:hypothetical protein
MLNLLKSSSAAGIQRPIVSMILLTTLTHFEMPSIEQMKKEFSVHRNSHSCTHKLDLKRNFGSGVADLQTAFQLWNIKA